MSLLGNIGTQLLGAVASRIATPRTSVQTLGGMMAGMSLPAATMARTLSALPQLPRPGAGFRTGGGFPANGFRMRKRRRTNPTNVHALRRALRRVEGFIKIEKRVDKILRRVAPKARTASKVGFVRKRR